MPTRAIGTKVIVPRNSSKESENIRKAIGETHTFGNRAIAYWEKILLEIRQEDILLDGEIIKSAKEWRKDLEKRLIENGVDPEHTEEACNLLKEFYPYIIPEEPNGGAYFNTLCNPNSVEGEKDIETLSLLNFEKYKDLPYKQLTEKQINEWNTFTTKVFKDNPGVLNRSGGQPKWLLQYKEHNSEWTKSLFDDLEKKGPAKAILSKLRTLGTFPICTPFGKNIVILDKKGNASRFERVAFNVAASNLKAHKTKTEDMKEGYEKEKNKLQEYRKGCHAQYAKELKHIRTYEKQRGKELANNTKHDLTKTYRITEREIRGWKKLRKWLLNNSRVSEKKRMDYCSELQTKNKYAFGGAEVLRWLANKEQDFITLSSEDVISKIVDLNALEAKFERKKERPQWTFTDPIEHPVALGFDPPNNTNQPGFGIESKGGKLRLTIRLLSRNITTNKLEQKDFVFNLAPSKQLVSPFVEEHRKVLEISYRAQDKLNRITKTIGGSFMQLERKALENKSMHDIQHGDFGSVFFRLTLKTAYVSTYKENKNHAKYFNHATANRTTAKAKACKPKEQRPIPIMSVDLGMNNPVSAAIFEIKNFNEDIEYTLKWSGTLNLPGEKSTEESQGFKELKNMIYDIERSLSELKSEKNFEEYRKKEFNLGIKIRELLKYSKELRKNRIPLGGKSIKRVEMLEALHRLIKSWADHKRPWEKESDENDKEAQVASAKKLSTHITNLKDDIAKTTADLIVQTARGLSYVNGRWKKTHDPVNIIVLEKLKSYLANKKRTKEENKRLMNWKHRTITNCVEQQAEEYGIAVVATSPSYSSQFDSTTMVPGYRCKQVTKEDIDRIKNGDYGWLRDHEIDPNKIKIGDLIPYKGGPLLAYVINGKLKTKHADINAAQNLGHWYITGYASTFKLDAHKLKDKAGCFVADVKKRGKGPLGSQYILLCPKKDKKTFEVVTISKKNFAKSEKTNKDVSFFRDLSGNIFDGNWVQDKDFWNIVTKNIDEYIKNS